MATIRSLAHHLGLPVRRDDQETAKILDELRPRLGDLNDDQRDRLTAQWRAVLRQRRWHRPYLRA
ncbi:hypothetical protein [Streptomyces griseosporeus]|uniref:hypothetical protein n=1 Tax=Streptomyces griseosporeus TaxID=1910 RepID=UPI00368A16B1